MLSLIDGDMLRYTLGFACQGLNEESGELEAAPEHIWKYTVDHFIADVVKNSGGEGAPLIYLTGAGNFRFEVAKRQPYKGSRKADKPLLYDEIATYLIDSWCAIMVTGMEADDAMVIEQTSNLSYSYIEASGEHILNKALCSTIICTLDKDLRMCPGWHYSWPVGEFIGEREPYFVDKMGGLAPIYHPTKTKNVYAVWNQMSGEPIDPTTVYDPTLLDRFSKGKRAGELKTKRVLVGTTPALKKLEGTGLTLFYAQLILGDSTDDIPGIPGMGEAKALEVLETLSTEEEMFTAVLGLYQDTYAENALEELMEQAWLLWMVNQLDENGNPVMWEPPIEVQNV